MEEQRVIVPGLHRFIGDHSLAGMDVEGQREHDHAENVRPQQVVVVAAMDVEPEAVVTLAAIEVASNAHAVFQLVYAETQGLARGVDEGMTVADIEPAALMVPFFSRGGTYRFDLYPIEVHGGKKGSTALLLGLNHDKAAADLYGQIIRDGGYSLSLTDDDDEEPTDAE